MAGVNNDIHTYVPLTLMRLKRIERVRVTCGSARSLDLLSCNAV